MPCSATSGPAAWAAPCPACSSPEPCLASFSARLYASTWPPATASSDCSPPGSCYRWACGCVCGDPTNPPTPATCALRRSPVSGFVVGIVGGIYGIGGGSLLGPILVGSGMPVAVVAPAALTATFLTSVAGVVTYGLLSLSTTGPVSPDWAIGVLCGLGGLIGGYLGARLQPRVPDTGLRILLGALAVGLAITYITQAASR